MSTVPSGLPAIHVPDRVSSPDVMPPGVAVSLLAVVTEINALHQMLRELRTVIEDIGAFAGTSFLSDWPEPDQAAMVRATLGSLLSEVPR